MRVIFVVYAQKRNILCIYIILLHIYVRPLPGRAALNMHDMQAALPLFRRSFRLFGPASIRKARAGFVIKAPQGSRAGYVAEYMAYRDKLIEQKAPVFIEIDVNPYGTV